VCHLNACRHPQGDGQHGFSDGRAVHVESEFAPVGASIATRSHFGHGFRRREHSFSAFPVCMRVSGRQAVGEGRHFLASDTTTTFLARNRVSSEETDVLVLVMLRNARRIAQYPDGRRIENVTPHDWLENIKGHYLMQVFVDEATDLSTVQLACMIELANPRLRFWFACGTFDSG
jgi:hypothetical protein